MPLKAKIWSLSSMVICVCDLYFHIRRCVSHTKRRACYWSTCLSVGVSGDGENTLWFDDDFEQGWYSQHSCIPALTHSHVAPKLDSACQSFAAGPLPQPPCSLTSSPTRKSCPQPNPASPPQPQTPPRAWAASCRTCRVQVCFVIASVRLNFSFLTWYYEHNMLWKPPQIK